MKEETPGPLQTWLKMKAAKKIFKKGRGGRMVVIGKVTNLGSGRTKTDKEYDWVELEGKEKFSSFNGTIRKAGIRMGDNVKITPWEKNAKYIDGIERVPDDVQSDLSQVRQSEAAQEKKEANIDNAVYLKAAAQLFTGSCDCMTDDKTTADIAAAVVRMRDRLMVLDGKK